MSFASRLSRFAFLAAFFTLIITDLSYADCPDHVGDLGDQPSKQKISDQDFRLEDKRARAHLRSKKDDDRVELFLVASPEMGLRDDREREGLVGKLNPEDIEFGQTHFGLAMQIILNELGISKLSVDEGPQLDLYRDDPFKKGSLEEMLYPIFRVNGSKSEIEKLLGFKERGAREKLVAWIGLEDPRQLIRDNSPLLTRTRWTREETQTMDWISKDILRSKESDRKPRRRIHFLVEANQPGSTDSEAIDKLRAFINELKASKALQDRVIIRPNSLGRFLPDKRMAGGVIYHLYEMEGIAKDLQTVIKLQAKTFGIGQLEDSKRTIAWFGVRVNDIPSK